MTMRFKNDYKKWKIWGIFNIVVTEANSIEVEWVDNTIPEYIRLTTIQPEGSTDWNEPDG